MKKHWSVDEKNFDLSSESGREQYEIWKLEDRINFGIGEVKISKILLLKYWDKLFIDPWKKLALQRGFGIV